MDRGFSLIEVLVATTIMTMAFVALAQLSILSIRVNHGARSTTFATLLAYHKIEQLRALTWSVDGIGAPTSDTSTDTTVEPAEPSGGTGLGPSPADALTQNTSGYCDFLDANGRTLGGGTTPPMSTAFIRRWSIDQLPAAMNATLVIQVSVTPIRSGGVAGNRRRLPDEARIVAVKTRKAG